jgi:ligand-binding sensor domain-containing protein
MERRLNVSSTVKLLGMIILVQLFLSPAWGLDPYKSVDQYLVEQWETSNGFPSNTINSIVQTPDGYLWLATSKGLVRFDGIKFSNIPFAGNEEISPLKITEPITLLVNREGSLWIGSTTGLTRCRNGRFETFTSHHGLTGSFIRHITEDMQGNLWISFMAGYVDRFSNGKFTPFNASHGLKGEKINAIVEDRSGNLLFATREKGIFSFRKGQFFPYPIPGLDNLSIITMHQDHIGDLWIGTNNGLLRVGGKGTIRYGSRQGLSHDYITVITEDSERNLWVGTLKGLNRLKKKQDDTAAFESLLEPFTIFSIFEDWEGSLWVGTDDSGIRRLKDRKFTAYAPLEAFPEEILSSLFQDQWGDIWVGTLGGMLFHCRGSSIIESIEPPELSGTGILAIAEDAEGNLWLGTNGKGVFQIKKGILNRFTTRDGLADSQVSSIFKDSRDNLWFATFDGVSVRRYPDGAFFSFTSGDGLSGKRVHNVYEDKAHNIWIATDRGINVIDDVRIAKKNMILYLQGISVTCIYEDPFVPEGEGAVYWIATHGAGLKRLSLKDGKIISYTTENGMATDFIYQFFEDQQRNFWLTSNSGILRVSKTELNRFASGVVYKIHCTSFGKADGLKSSEFHNEFSKNSVLKAENGELWFLTKKGISIVDPAEIGVSKLPPPVVIEAVFIDGQSIPLNMDSEAYKFKGISNFRFHFTAPTFLSPEKIKFNYKLEGVDKQWIFLPPGKGRVARYENIEPGTYTFRVIASNADGVWNRTGDSITFTLARVSYLFFFSTAYVFQ